MGDPIGLVIERTRAVTLDTRRSRCGTRAGDERQFDCVGYDSAGTIVGRHRCRSLPPSKRPLNGVSTPIGSDRMIDS